MRIRIGFALLFFVIFSCEKEAPGKLSPKQDIQKLEELSKLSETANQKRNNEKDMKKSLQKVLEKRSDLREIYSKPKLFEDKYYFDRYLIEYIQNGDIEAVEMLLTINPKLDRFLFNQSTKKNQSAINIAIKSRDLDMLKCLIESGANPEYGLRFATLIADTTILNVLFKYHANINACDGTIEYLGEDCFRILPEAVRAKNMTLVEFLIRKGADPTDGLTAALLDDNLNLARQLFNWGAKPDAYTDTHGYILFALIERHRSDAVKLLLDNGVSLDYT